MLKGVQVISEQLVGKVNDDRVGSGTFLCVTCRTRLIKDPSCVPPRRQPSPIPSSSQPTQASSSSSSQDQASQRSSPLEAEIEKEESDAVLQLLGETPLRQSEYKTLFSFSYLWLNDVKSAHLIMLL